MAGLFTGRFRRRAKGHFAGLTLLREDDANSFGVESAGPWQVRGNGNLALTEHELLFAQWVPSRLVRIPRNSIVEVTTARSHLGKTMGGKLLKVIWTSEVGAQDSIALRVEDLDGWLEALGPAALCHPLGCKPQTRGGEMPERPALYVCHGDEGGPSRPPLPPRPGSAARGGHRIREGDRRPRSPDSLPAQGLT